MYFVVSGAHGIGKSTICKLVAKKIGGIYLSEAMDEIIPPPQFGPKSPEKVEGQLWHIRQQLIKEKQITDSSKIYIADRGWADIYVYTKVLLKPESKDILNSLIDALPKKIPDIHIIFHANINKIIERIKKRKRQNLIDWGEDDIDYLKKINQGFINYYNAFRDLKRIYLVDISGTLEESITSVINIIQENQTDI
ncbi:MAG: hypothetical protein B6U88_02740 [Candidatus Aenigmarchaeota archaeon ex4484_56]|nr:MAG: hypothetical protein B6U88_02740 [Candidatus Aenigmarchaeota archaeon ex4484_56]